MQEILFGYDLKPTTWAYVSALMMIGIYFKFRRFWSVRNLDLAALIAFTPGFLLLYHGLMKANEDLVRDGYVWLFAAGAFFLVRLLLDPVMVRRPLLEPNLSAGGLAFTGVSLLIFMTANIIMGPKDRLEYELAQIPSPASPSPGYSLFYSYFAFQSHAADAGDKSKPTENKGVDSKGPETKGFDNLTLSPANRPAALKPSVSTDTHREALIRSAATRTAAILAHLAVVIGMVWIGFRHFDNIHTGVAAATLYLLAFSTSQLTSLVDHSMPAALLIWAVAAYRRPMIAGVLLGLAAGLVYYPIFLLPLWLGFYWRRGLARFISGTVLALAVLVISLALASPDSATFFDHVKLMFGLRNPIETNLSGFWHFYDSAYRIPVMAAFIALAGSLAIWPAQKNLGTLLSCSAAVMLAAQFWHADQGGLYMGWYLPLLILTIFRPNLEDRVAISAVLPMWRRKTPA